MKELKTILAEEFPELKVEEPVIPGNSDISEEELLNALKYIRNNNLVQDSARLLTYTEPMRSCVTYPIIFSGQQRDIEFKVRWVQGPMVYIGTIQTQDNIGREVIQARFYGMHIR
jgi:hypothetical protein